MHYICLVFEKNPVDSLATFDSFGEAFKTRGPSGEGEYVNPDGEFDKTGLEMRHLFPALGSQRLSASRFGIDRKKTFNPSDCLISAMVIDRSLVSSDDFPSRKEWISEVIMLLDNKHEEAICTAVNCHC